MEKIKSNENNRFKMEARNWKQEARKYLECKALALPINFKVDTPVDGRQEAGAKKEILLPASTNKQINRLTNW